MSDQVRLEATFVEHLPTIERVVSVCCRRNGIGPSDAEDVLSWVRLRFIESDYAPIARFRGESSLATYLTVVVASLVREWRIHHWGRWRPSSAARHKGDVAVRLECLVHRDGHALKEAAEHLRTSGETTMTDHALADLLASLPARPPLRPVEVGDDDLAQAESVDKADGLVEAAEKATSQGSIDSALTQALDGLAVEERLIVRMHYWEGASVAEIARALGLMQKPLYRRLDRALAYLRARLEASGISRQLAQTVLEEPAQ